MTTHVTREDASSWHWGYNNRGEVESAVRNFPDNTPVPLESYGYSFDAIGNPLTRTQGAQTKFLTPNALNQISARTQPPFLPINGSASSSAKVIVNSTATQRKEGYFWAELPVNNTANALYEKVIVTSSLPAVGSNGTDLITQKIGTLYVPPASQTMVHDDDGNLIQDSRWDYAWDAENRLISATERANSAAPSAHNPPRIKLEFVYDTQHRRLGKRVYLWSASSTSWVLDRTVRFFWDGWHLVYERHTPSYSGTVRDFHYVWGLDITGTRGGAGGVGGLLYAISAGSYTQTNPGRERRVSDYNYIPAQDANGNVTALLAVEANNSLKLDASYHYDAFGMETANTLRSQDVNGREFPFRFSSKYHDAETGLAYYGYRHYAPELGRWLSRDPIEEQGGVNLYGMVGNDPVNRWDYLGQHDQVETPFYVLVRKIKHNPGDGADVWLASKFPILTHAQIDSDSPNKAMLWVAPKSTVKPPDQTFSIWIDLNPFRKMDDKSPCECASIFSVESCLKRNPYSQGAGCFGDNCHSSVITSIRSCCLKTNYSPPIYGWPTIPRGSLDRGIFPHVEPPPFTLHGN